MRRTQIIEANAIAYYRELSRCLGGQFSEQAEIVWFATGRRSLPRFNGVLRTVVARPEELGGVVRPVLDLFLARDLPFFWVDWPAVGTPGLGRHLQASGLALTAITMPAMTRTLKALPRAPLPPEVELSRVQTVQDQAAWLNVFMAGSDLPAPARPDFGQFLAGSLAEPAPVFNHFLARWHGEPCAVSTLLRAGSAAGIYHVATLPAFRGCGLGTALTLAAMQAAQAVGAETAILFATPSGFPVYQRMGFETASTADLHIWTGAGSPASG